MNQSAVLAGLSAIDHLVPFSADTPEELIREIRPQIFAKGGDYSLDTLPEAPLVQSLGGIVRILAYLDDRSTTRMISRIRSVNG